MSTHLYLYFSISSVKFQLVSGLKLQIFNTMECCGETPNLLTWAYSSTNTTGKFLTTSSFVVLGVRCHVSRIICHMSHVRCRMLFVMCHVSCVLCHLSHVRKANSNFKLWDQCPFIPFMWGIFFELILSLDLCIKTFFKDARMTYYMTLDKSQTLQLKDWIGLLAHMNHILPVILINPWQIL